MKRLPKHDLPNENEIWKVALKYLPKDYVLKRVECTYGSGGFPAIVPEDFEVTIEYGDKTDKRFKGEWPRYRKIPELGKEGRSTHPL